MHLQEFDKKDLIEAAQIYHSGQFDSLGCPYWLHPYRVALEAKNLAMEFALDIDYMNAFVVGLFHDVVEDTDIPLEELASRFDNNQEILRDILILTKPKIVQRKGLLDHPLVLEETRKLLQKMWDSDEYKTYESWVESILEFSPNAVAPLVKYCDNCDNSLPWRSKRVLGINKKYDVSKKMLKEHLLNLASDNVIEFMEAA